MALVEDTISTDASVRLDLRDDASFAMTPANHPTADLFGVHGEYLTVAPSRGIEGFSGLSPSVHLSTWCNTLRKLHDHTSLPILAIPHVQELAHSTRDDELATAIGRELNWPEWYRTVGGDLRASEYKGLISRSEFVIGERMHACFAGLSTGVPTLAIEYSPKSRRVLTDMLGTECERFLFALTSDNGDEMAKAAIRAWDERGIAKQLLGDYLDQSRKDPSASDLIAELLQHA